MCPPVRRLAHLKPQDLELAKPFSFPEGVRVLGRRESDIAVINAAIAAQAAAPQLQLIRPDRIPGRLWAQLNPQQRSWFSRAEAVLEDPRASLDYLRIVVAAHFIQMTARRQGRGQCSQACAPALSRLTGTL